MNKKLRYLLFLLLISCQNSEKQTHSIDSILKDSIKSIVDTLNQPQLLKPDTILTSIESEPLDLNNIQKVEVSLIDSSFWVNQNIRKDYRIFGYEDPDTNSQKLIIFSVFTYDIENNPYECPLGAYYGSSGLENRIIKYRGKDQNFIIADFLEEGQITKLYFDKRWVEFSK